MDTLQITKCPTFIRLQREVTDLTRDPKTKRYLATLNDAEDKALMMHSIRVGEFYEGVLAELLNVPFGRGISGFSNIGFFHDAGKIVNPEIHRLTRKPRILSEEEMNEVRRHVVLIQNFLGQDEYPLVQAIILGHHEYGQSRPHRRATIHTDENDWQVRLFLRVVLSVVDKADSLSSNRPYRQPLPLEEIRGILVNEGGYSEKLIDPIMTHFPFSQD